MAVSVREHLQASSLASPITVVTGAGTQAGDVLVALHFTAFYGAADMQAPSVASGVGTWTLIATARNDSSNAPHIKAWWAPVTTGGAKSVDFNHAQADPPNNAALFVLAGADTTTPVSGSGVLDDAFGTAQVAPSVTGAADGLLACGWVCDDLVNYTAPGSMTGSETESSFNTAMGAYELLTATGATGTRTATSSAAKTHSAISVGISPAAGGGPIVVNVGQAVEVDTGTAITRRKALAVGQATEADTAGAVGRLKARSVGQATEVDTAAAVGRLKLRTVGQASEVDTATAVGRRKTLAVGQAVEVDTAQPITVPGVIVVNVGQAVELDSAPPVGRLKARAVGTAAEVDTANAVGRVKARLVGQAVEVDTAGTVTVSGGAPIEPLTPDVTVDLAVPTRAVELGAPTTVVDLAAPVRAVAL